MTLLVRGNDNLACVVILLSHYVFRRPCALTTVRAPVSTPLISLY